MKTGKYYVIGEMFLLAASEMVKWKTGFNGVNREIPEHIYVLLKHKFTCYSVFLPSIYSTS